MEKNLLILVSLFITAAALTACNTAQGLGEDVRATGSALERAATPPRR